jgi:hypothetical protein
MDSHTNRIVSTSGLFPDHMLPPVRKMGVVYLDEPLTEKEIVLHDAKKALKDYEDGIKQGLGAIELVALQTKLSKALFALRGETQYFMERYMATNKLLMNPPQPKPSTTQAAAVAARQKYKEANERKRQAILEAAEARQKIADRKARDDSAARKLEEEENKETSGDTPRCRSLSASYVSARHVLYTVGDCRLRETRIGKGARRS